MKRVIQALGASWHAHHFVCGGCRKDMGGGSFIERAGRPYCSSCYAHKFASRCAGCGTPITALDAKWHRECFTCTKCRKPVTDSRCWTTNRLAANAHKHTHRRTLLYKILFIITYTQIMDPSTKSKVHLLHCPFEMF